MNMHINPEAVAAIQAEMEADQHKGTIEKAIEDADAIRENLVAVKGEDFARLVEIGVLVHKHTKLVAFLADIVSSVVEDFGREQRTALGHVAASIGAKMLSHASLIYSKDDLNREQAEELTNWIDKIVDAEHRGVEKFASELFGEDHED